METTLKACVKINLPETRQTHRYDCGANCLKGICRYYGVGPDDEDAYIEMIHAKPDGAHPKDIVKAARSLGLKAEFHNRFSVKRLKKCLDESKPVICEIQAWCKPENYHKLVAGHFVVAIGYDDDHIFFEDPLLKSARGFLGWDEFVGRWKEREMNGDLFTRSVVIVWKEGVPLKKKVLNKARHID